MTYPVCPCDADPIAPPVNLPELSYISYRVGTYVSFRQAVLMPLFSPGTPLPIPLEQTLSVNGVPVWRTDGAGDLAVMIAEWFAYIADIITFYNERIANQDYLRTADLPESVNNLIALLGYRPRPAIGAYGSLAALLSPGPSFGQKIVLPQGLQFQSKPTPGLPPQIFELSAATTITAPDQLPAIPAPTLLGDGSTLLLQGAVTGIAAGDLLLLSALDGTGGGPWLATAGTAATGPAPSGSGQQTSLPVTWTGSPPPASLTAATASLQTAKQNAALWSFFPGYAITGGGVTVDLASLARQIQPGDWLLFVATGGSAAPVLAQVASATDVIWDANATAPSTPPFAASSTTTTTKSGGSTTTTITTTNPLPIPHTELTLTAAALSGWNSGGTGVSVQFGWVSVGTLLDQPPCTWDGTPEAALTLTGTSGQNFPAWNGHHVLLQDANGVGIATIVSSPGGGTSVAVGKLPDPAPKLQPPFLVLPNLLPVTCGKTIANETLGSGDATNPAQDFQLSQSPVTYLMQGATYASTIALTVNNLPWTEVPDFFGQAPDATVFVTREDNQGNTHVMFGDGVNGARLPTGVNNVVATYRIGSGSAMPPAGKLTVIAKSYPGLRSVLNPVAVIGGADADLPSQIQHDAPRSVLAFGRAVSVFDYQALAAEVPSVTRASAVWGWDDARQRTLVKIYVGDTSGAAAAAKKALDAIGDPNRPVKVTLAARIAVRLELTLLVTPGMDTTIISAAVVTALTDTEVGLFGSWNMAIGQTVFESQIEAAVLDVQGAVAITVQNFIANGVTEPGPLHLPGDGAYYALDPTAIHLTMEPNPNV